MAGGDGGDVAEGGEAGLVGGERGGVEVIVAVGGEEGAVDVAFLQAGEDGLQVRGEGGGGGFGWIVEWGGWSGFGNEEVRDLFGDIGCGVGGFLVGEDGDSEVVVGEEDVFGDKATDFAGVLDGLVAVEDENLDAETVVGVFAVGKGEGGLKLLVAGWGEERLVDDGEVPLEGAG